MSKQVQVGRLLVAEPIQTLAKNMCEESGRSIAEMRDQIAIEVRALCTEAVPTDLLQQLLAYGDLVVSQSARDTNEYQKAIVEWHKSAETWYSQQAKTFGAKGEIVPRVSSWFTDSEVPIDTLGLDFLILETEELVERFDDIISVHAHGDVVDVAGVLDAVDAEFTDGISLTASLRKGVAMMISWRMSHPESGFLIDEEQ